MNAKFDLGEKTGLKADSNQVSADMRNTQYEENNCRFCREEWLTKNQIKSFFSRLASAKRKGQDDVDDRAGPEDMLGEQEENSRQLLINSIIEKIGLRHPIYYDVYNLIHTDYAIIGGPKILYFWCYLIILHADVNFSMQSLCEMPLLITILC